MKKKPEIFWDCHGVDVIGIDSDGLWWGTENAWMVIGDPCMAEHGGPDEDPATPTYFVVEADWEQGQTYVAHLVASEANFAIWRVEGMGGDKARVIFEKKLSKRHKYSCYGTVYLTDEQRARRLGEPYWGGY